MTVAAASGAGLLGRRRCEAFVAGGHAGTRAADRRAAAAAQVGQLTASPNTRMARRGVGYKLENDFRRLDQVAVVAFHALRARHQRDRVRREFAWDLRLKLREGLARTTASFAGQPGAGEAAVADP